MSEHTAHDLKGVGLLVVLGEHLIRKLPLSFYPGQSKGHARGYLRGRCTPQSINYNASVDKFTKSTRSLREILNRGSIKADQWISQESKIVLAIWAVIPPSVGSTVSRPPLESQRNNTRTRSGNSTLPRQRGGENLRRGKIACLSPG